MAERRRIAFGTPSIGEEEKRAVMDVLESGWLGSGPRAKAFESAFAAYQNAPQAVAVSSCTAALHLSLIAAGIRPGDEVITTALTFAATVNAIIQAGATPVLADIDPATRNIDPDRVRALVTPRTRALLPVHFAGRPAEMAALMDIAQQYGLVVIEDCAHAIETRIGDQAAGTIGDFGCFSFYPTKNMTSGEGGMILPRDPRHAGKLRRLTRHGQSTGAWDRFDAGSYRQFEVVEMGYKYNLPDILAAIGLEQLKKIDERWRRRRIIWERYLEAFADLPLVSPAAVAPGTRHAFHMFTLAVDEAHCGLSRERFIDAMSDRDVGLGVHYLAIPEHRYYRERYGWRPEGTPHAITVGRQTVSLPLSPALSDDDIDHVIEAVRSTVREGRNR